MGLAASQARFLGITLRKANCEYKSTELAQQRLELTNQMIDVSQEYANALNSTKLIWRNDAVTDSFGNSGDYGLSYSLLMMPSAANDYNPYMLSSRSGAIILNSRYAQAAKDAGISMSGSTPSAEGRSKFLASLAGLTVGTQNKQDNVITPTTYNILEKGVDSTANVSWNASAGMGAIPKVKTVAGAVTLTDLVTDSDIGGRTLDWLQIYKSAAGLSNRTQYEIDNANYDNAVIRAENNLRNAINPQTGDYYDSTTIEAIIQNAKYQAKSMMSFWIHPTGSMAEFKELESKIAKATNADERIQYTQELNLLKQGYKMVQTQTGYVKQPVVDEFNKSSELSPYTYPLYWALYQKYYNLRSEEYSVASNGSIKWTYDGTGGGILVNVHELFYTLQNSEIGGRGSEGNNGIEITSTDRKLDYLNILTLCVNGNMKKSADYITNMKISDLFTEDVTIIAQATENGINNDPQKTIRVAAEAMLKSVASTLGYGNIGTGMNTDDETNVAMELAMQMAIKKFINAAPVSGNYASDSDLNSNSAYLSAQDYNAMGVTSNGEYAAINLSNLVSAFLTYYDNFLRGAESGYVVGKGIKDDKTFYVTDDPTYAYILAENDDITNDEKIADFFNQLYNNICAHGWRYDDMVQDSNYMESAVKDGRYQIMALNNDGYFYQMRYNELGYLEEVQDTDAIARAESDYKTKKAQITFKEDQIDVKTKKLDAEITELNTEINSVQNIISKSIEKTFSMFSN